MFLAPPSNPSPSGRLEVYGELRLFLRDLRLAVSASAAEGRGAAQARSAGRARVEENSRFLDPKPCWVVLKGNSR